MGRFPIGRRLTICPTQHTDLLHANVSQHLRRNTSQVSTQSRCVGSDVIVHVRNKLHGTVHRILHHAAFLGIDAKPNHCTTENENAFKYSGHDPLLLAQLTKDGNTRPLLQYSFTASAGWPARQCPSGRLSPLFPPRKRAQSPWSPSL